MKCGQSNEESQRGGHNEHNGQLHTGEGRCGRSGAVAACSDGETTGDDRSRRRHFSLQRRLGARCGRGGGSSGCEGWQRLKRGCRSSGGCLLAPGRCSRFGRCLVLCFDLGELGLQNRSDISALAFALAGADSAVVDRIYRIA